MELAIMYQTIFSLPRATRVVGPSRFKATDVTFLGTHTGLRVFVPIQHMPGYAPSQPVGKNMPLPAYYSDSNYMVLGNPHGQMMGSGTVTEVNSDCSSRLLDSHETIMNHPDQLPGPAWFTRADDGQQRPASSCQITGPEASGGQGFKSKGIEHTGVMRERLQGRSGRALAPSSNPVGLDFLTFGNHGESRAGKAGPEEIETALPLPLTPLSGG